MHLPLTPIRCLFRAMELYPKKQAVIFGHHRLTYAEFGDQCLRMASALRSATPEGGERVAFLSFNTHLLLEAYFGVPLAGLVLLPLNVRLHASELRIVIEHAQPRLLFYECEFAPIIEELRAALTGCEFIPIEHAEGRSLATMMQEQQPLAFDLTSVNETTMAELFYTSGSTGRPKGVMLSHRTLYLHALSLASSFNHDDSNVVLHTIPLFHANGWGFPHFGTMCGFKHVLVRRFDPLQVFRLIQEEGATIMILVPAMATALLKCPERSQFDTSSLKLILLGGASSSKELIARMKDIFPDTAIHTGYGLTETAPVVCTARLKGTLILPDAEQLHAFSASTGWPVVGVEVKVMGADGTEVSRDESSIGEIWVRGDTVMDGYYREPELTREAIVDVGWFRTGDMAVWNLEGCIDIVDRKKDLIISGGENIASIEIENAILAHPSVLECAVVAAPNERWGEVPLAVVVLHEGASSTSEELLQFASARLSRFKLPQEIVLRSDPLPRTGTGKIMKRELREAFWTGKARRIQG